MPPPAAREHLAAALDPLRGVPGAPRWVSPHRWHVTVLFLGSVAEDVVAGGGRFGSVRRPRVLWIGLVGAVGPLAELAGRLSALTRSRGVAVEDRPFRPHLTVGRWSPQDAVDGALVERLADYRGPDWPVTGVGLFASRLGPRPAHTELAHWPIGGHPDPGEPPASFR